MSRLLISVLFLISFCFITMDAFKLENLAVASLKDPPGDKTAVSRNRGDDDDNNNDPYPDLSIWDRLGRRSVDNLQQSPILSELLKVDEVGKKQLPNGKVIKPGIGTGMKISRTRNRGDSNSNGTLEDHFIGLSFWSKRKRSLRSDDTVLDLKELLADRED